MGLINRIKVAIENDYEDSEMVEYYIKKWHVADDSDFNYYTENFKLERNDYGRLDLLATLHGIGGETLLQIAVDLGIETPDFIPSVAYFKNYIKHNYKSASEAFATAIKNVDSHPDVAIGIANSTLEGIIKQILSDNRMKTKLDSNLTLYELTIAVLKELKLHPNNDLPEEIRNISSSLLKANQNIEKLRSEKTVLHGKIVDDYIVRDSMYAYFVINAVSTIGLFLNSYYKYKMPKAQIFSNSSLDDDLPF